MLLDLTEEEFGIIKEILNEKKSEKQNIKEKEKEESEILKKMICEKKIEKQKIKEKEESEKLEIKMREHFNERIYVTGPVCATDKCSEEDIADIVREEMKRARYDETMNRKGHHPL
jgi:GTPase Era involved in 16S rRNA processing